MVTNYPSDADYLLRAFAPASQGGHLLIETWHRGEASKDVELSALVSRRARGDLGRIEVIDCHRHTTTVIA